MNTLTKSRRTKQRLLDHVEYELKGLNDMLYTCEDWSAYQEILADIDRHEETQDRLLTELYGGRQ
jgi:hypothetical protein